MKKLSLFVLVFLACAGCRQPTGPMRDMSDPIATASPDPRLDWWREARFGLFIHWGLYAVLEGEWQQQPRYGEWIRHSAKIPLEEYDQLVDRFSIERFDAGRWADLAKAAGMKYVVITTKHHDGFCLWPSDLTDFDIASTPAGRDVMQEIADAFRERGLQVCWYHSIMDWHHPDYLPRRGWETDRSSDRADFDRYFDYLSGQVEELLTRYGPIGVMWFDGEWEGTWTHRHGSELYELCRRIQPDVIVNNRVDKGRGGMAGMTTNPGFVGDFGTPEQEIPATGMPGIDWETCMTMNRHWGWNRADTEWKSSRDLIRKLCDIASKGGNFLLNVGPRPDGTFPELAVERLEAIGAWMDRFGEAIHGSSASPIPAPSWGRVTSKRRGDQTTLYLHVFDWPIDGDLELDDLGNQPLRARLLDGDAPLSVERVGASILIAGLPAAASDPDCTVVAVDIAGEPIVYRAPTIDAFAERFLDAVDVTLESSSATLGVRYTLDGTEPDAASPQYEQPITLTATTTVTARAFHDGAPVGPLAVRRFEKVVPRAAVTVDPAILEAGLWCETYAGKFDVVPDFDGLTPEEERIGVAAVGLPADPARELIARRFTGFLAVSEEGVYSLALTSDDGSRLWIGEDLVVDNDGKHGTKIVTATAPLARGLHPITIAWFNNTGGAELGLSMSKVGEEPSPVDGDRLRRVR